MKLALVGYGNMGSEIEDLVAKDGKHEIVSVSFKQITDPLDRDGIKKADVAIDFTAPTVVLKNMETILGLGIPLVVGTTGWYDSLPEVEKLVQTHDGGVIYAKNFSVGANMFFQITEFAAKLAATYGGYDVYGLEIHHTGKKDSPSGTAKKIADTIMKQMPAKTKLQTEKLDRQIEQSELHFASIRGGRNPGFHQVSFDSDADMIQLSHSAHGRRGFAKGAILAAEFIHDKKGLFEFEKLFIEEELS